MAIINKAHLLDALKFRAREYGKNCKHVFVAASGGVDSSLVLSILCEEFGANKVVALHRQFNSNPMHLADVKDLQKVLGFKLIQIDITSAFCEILADLKKEFISNHLEWHDEGTKEAEVNGWGNAYASFRSRSTTPISGFIAKAIDNGRGRIFGTGNMEEDGLLRYFDKFGDGAVDNNILDGLLKYEVRQLLVYIGEKSKSNIFLKIARKIPSADLKAIGDAHNDEGELMSLARKLGFRKAKLTYGDENIGGTIAWLVNENIKKGIITGKAKSMNGKELKNNFKYTGEQIDNILFARFIEKNSRHKVEVPPGLSREELIRQKLVI